jgi:hypothetical protein
MTLNSETEIHETSEGNYEGHVVDLEFTSTSSPEAYDPTNPSGTTQGNQRLRSLLGVAVLSANADVDVVYDEPNRQFRIRSPDGTAFTGSVTIRAHLKGDRAP